MDPVKAVLVGVDTRSASGSPAETSDLRYSMGELADLALALDIEAGGFVTQKLDNPNPGLYVGPGKTDEIKEAAEKCGASLIIFNDTLTPSQLRNLKEQLGISVQDRTGLILDIFEKRARTKEAKLQVEAAKLQYMLPRLMSYYEEFTRQGGTSGSMSSRGEGETKLELDRRKIEHRLAELNASLKQIIKVRETQRKRRSKSGIPKVALVGYTNAGKSTVLNSLLEKYGRDDEKKVIEADMLFATLDANTRHITPEDGRDFLLTDTVGFIHKLPAGLIKAFRSTLEEACEADLLLLVVDYSDPHYPEQIEVTRETLTEIGAGAIPRIIVYNKCDLEPGAFYPRLKKGDELSTPDRLYISAKEDASLEMLIKHISDTVYSGYVEAEFLIPYVQSALVNTLMTEAQVLSCDYRAEGTLLKVSCAKAYYEKYKEYLAH